MTGGGLRTALVSGPLSSVADGRNGVFATPPGSSRPAATTRATTSWTRSCDERAAGEPARRAEAPEAGRRAGAAATSRPAPGALILSVGTVALRRPGLRASTPSRRGRWGRTPTGPSRCCGPRCSSWRSCSSGPSSRRCRTASPSAWPPARTPAASCAGVARLAVAAAALAILACVLAWGPLTDRLFAGQDVLTAMLVAGIAGYGAVLRPARARRRPALVRRLRRAAAGRRRRAARASRCRCSSWPRPRVAGAAARRRGLRRRARPSCWRPAGAAGPRCTARRAPPSGRSAPCASRVRRRPSPWPTRSCSAAARCSSCSPAATAPRPRPGSSSPPRCSSGRRPTSSRAWRRRCCRTSRPCASSATTWPSAAPSAARSRSSWPSPASWWPGR